MHWLPGAKNERAWRDGAFHHCLPLTRGVKRPVVAAVTPVKNGNFVAARSCAASQQAVTGQATTTTSRQGRREIGRRASSLKVRHPLRFWWWGWALCALHESHRVCSRSPRGRRDCRTLLATVEGVGGKLVRLATGSSCLSRPERRATPRQHFIPRLAVRRQAGVRFLTRLSGPQVGAAEGGYWPVARAPHPLRGEARPARQVNAHLLWWRGLIDP